MRPESLDWNWASSVEVLYHLESVMSFRRQGRWLVTNAKVQRQVWAPVPVILSVGSKQSLAVTNLSGEGWIGEGDRTWLVLKESGQRGESEKSVSPRDGENIVLHSLPRKP